MMIGGGRPFSYRVLMAILLVPVISAVSWAALLLAGMAILHGRFPG